MPIERDAKIKFHEHGTLQTVTRWIHTHDEGLAEWLKNARRAYQRDRSDVAEEHRAALLLLADAKGDHPARIAFLDVGGATLEDVERWSTWQDPDASSRGSTLDEEETQGNGGKAYMYSRFKGPTQILGVHDGRLNRKGMEGDKGSVKRGTPVSCQIQARDAIWKSRRGKPNFRRLWLHMTVTSTSCPRSCKTQFGLGMHLQSLKESIL